MHTKIKWPLTKLIEVEWDDAAVKGKWCGMATYEECEPCRCRTVGYLLKADQRRVVIIQNQSRDGDVSDSMTIPRGCVRKMRKLK